MEAPFDYKAFGKVLNNMLKNEDFWDNSRISNIENRSPNIEYRRAESEVRYSMFEIRKRRKHDDCD